MPPSSPPGRLEGLSKPLGELGVCHCVLEVLCDAPNRVAPHPSTLGILFALDLIGRPIASLGPSSHGLIVRRTPAALRGRGQSVYLPMSRTASKSGFVGTVADRAIERSDDVVEIRTTVDVTGR